ncbi:hypothetical protein CMV_027755 [Castanea mollissima]|uniref:Uncharacterized protein n=1 Tax=Castanea mollissima TaxID=60419 RepID=A0A8J4Q9T1_9ROSI|nr:hypothetical protein CMV_027755 [Castanea mollissima]
MTLATCMWPCLGLDSMHMGLPWACQHAQWRFFVHAGTPKGDGDNIIPNSIKCIIGKTYIFQVKVTAYNFFVRKQNFTETTKRTKNGNEVSKETICTEVKKRTFLKK